MLAQADQNNMGSLSKQHGRNKMADSTVHLQRSEVLVQISKISGGTCSRTSLELFGASGTRNTGHLRLWRNLQQASHALETLRLDCECFGRHIGLETRRKAWSEYKKCTSEVVGRFTKL